MTEWTEKRIHDFEDRTQAEHQRNRHEGIWDLRTVKEQQNPCARGFATGGQENEGWGENRLKAIEGGNFPISHTHHVSLWKNSQEISVRHTMLKLDVKLATVKTKAERKFLETALEKCYL